MLKDRFYKKLYSDSDCIGTRSRRLMLVHVSLKKRGLNLDSKGIFHRMTILDDDNTLMVKLDGNPILSITKFVNQIGNSSPSVGFRHKIF